jgi:hypothetical protein
MLLNNIMLLKLEKSLNDLFIFNKKNIFYLLNKKSNPMPPNL